MNRRSPLLPSRPATARILGIRVDLITTPRLLAHLAEAIRAGRKEMVLNVNIHAFNLAHADPTFRQLLDQAAVVFCDGVGVKWGARLLGYSIPEVITYDHFIWDLAAFCEAHGFSLFLLGGYPSDIGRARDRLLARHPGLRILGAHHGFFEKAGPENDTVLRLVNAARPDVLVCSFGMPVQEKWIGRNLSRLNARVFLSAGGCIDLLSGRAPRPPAWMARSGMRWLFRFTYEPRRVFRRYVFGNPLFMLRVLREALLGRRASQ